MSTYNQTSFAGGMNLRVDDTRLQPDQYKVAFNVRNRDDTLEPILKSEVDPAAPAGIKQGILTFGKYIIIFVAGYAYYRYYTATGWNKVESFQMSTEAERFWYEAVPISTTNYKRYLSDADSIANGINIQNIAAAFGGDVPGLVVQDNINQPYFIFIDPTTLIPVARVTQTYAEWSVDWAAYTIDKDKREYVPVGNEMKYVDGVLYVASPATDLMLRSVSGSPLDFVIAVDINGQKAGDAYTTAYSVGVSGISTFHGLADGSIFVGAGNSNFAVSKNMTPGARTIYGEYTFIRKFLFSSTCLDERCIIDTLGDTRFISLSGISSFNAILQLQNEGKNSIFSIDINGALGTLRQTAGLSAAILFDNYELYAINSIFGPVIAVYDSINQKWVCFDNNQTDGQRIKQFAKIELDITRLYAITEDNRLFTLYNSDEFDDSFVRPPSVCANNLATEKQPIPDLLGHEVKPTRFRCILNNMTEAGTATLTTFVNNKVTQKATTKTIKDAEVVAPYVGPVDMPDVDTQLVNVCWDLSGAAQGWKSYFLLGWTGGGTLTQISATMKDETPQNPLNSQGSVK